MTTVVASVLLVLAAGFSLRRQRPAWIRVWNLDRMSEGSTLRVYSNFGRDDHSYTKQMGYWTDGTEAITSRELYGRLYTD